MSLLTFLNDIKASQLMVDTSGHEALSIMINSIQHGITIPNRQDLAVLNTCGQSYDSSSKNPFDTWEKGSIAIIPLNGIMFKSGSWWYYGVDEIAHILQLAYESDRISAVLFKGNTPGGSTDSVYVLEEVLRNKTKPTYMLVTGMLCSCGIYVGSFFDKIYAINDMCNVGSLGVFARLIAPNENGSYKIVEVYPDESHLKNYPEREALKDNDKPLKDELSKLANHFGDILKENRPQITDRDVYAGKTYIAREAVAIGLIDGVKSESTVIKELQALTSISDDVKNQISNSLK